MVKLCELATRHFEAALFLYFWMNACALAIIAGRPKLGLLGLLTVLPSLGAYARAVRRRSREEVSGAAKRT